MLYIFYAGKRNGVKNRDRCGKSEFYLPGQSSLLHSFISMTFPSHFQCKQLLVLDNEPLPHVTVHFDQSDQTENSWKVNVT